VIGGGGVPAEACTPAEAAGLLPGSLHRIRVAWLAPATGTPVQYIIARAEGAPPAIGADDFVQIATVGGSTLTFVDPTELPNGVQFTYVAHAVYEGAKVSRASNADTVTAVNDPPVGIPPVAVADAFSVGQGAVLNVAAPGILGNDVDLDGTSTRVAVLVAGQGPFNGSLVLNPNGSFSYTPLPGFIGQDSFQYRTFNQGPPPANRQLSELSAPVTVAITVTVPPYGFINVKNLPPPSGTTFKASMSSGTLVDFEWKFTLNGVVAGSENAQPSVQITYPNGTVKTYFPYCTVPAGAPSDVACDKFVYNSKGSANLWDFHWKPRNAAPGTYYVIVFSGRTGQRFPATGPGFEVKFKN
jgi:hypothetical protein